MHGVTVRGVHPEGLITVVSVQWFGTEALELTYKTAAGTIADAVLYRLEGHPLWYGFPYEDDPQR